MNRAQLKMMIPAPVPGMIFFFGKECIPPGPADFNYLSVKPDRPSLTTAGGGKIGGKIAGPAGKIDIGRRAVRFFSQKKIQISSPPDDPDQNRKLILFVSRRRRNIFLAGRVNHVWFPESDSRLVRCKLPRDKMSAWKSSHNTPSRADARADDRV